MADPVALRTMLTRMNCTAAVANHIIDPDGQALTTIEDFARMDDGDVSSLCKAIRRPGGTIGAGTDADPTRPNPGMNLPGVVETNLMSVCYFLKHQLRTSRPLDPAQVTLESVRDLHQVRKAEKANKDYEPDAPKIDPNNWPKTMDDIITTLETKLGIDGNPLSYVGRDKQDVKPHAEDPAADYATTQAEMVARAPIVKADGSVHPTFKEDNQQVWLYLSEWMKTKPAFPHIKRFRKKKDGRGALLHMQLHFVGSTAVDVLTGAAERSLQSASYTGEHRRQNFETLVTHMKEQHLVLEEAESKGCKGIDERSKVRYLLDAIPQGMLEGAKNHVIGSTEQMNNFDLAVDHFKKVLATQRTFQRGKRSFQVSAVKTDQEEWDAIEPDMSIPDRYYKKPEYDQLTRAQKKGLIIKRAKRGGGKRKAVRFDKRTIKALIAAFKAQTIKEDDKGDSDGESNADEPAAKKNKGNRDHPALKKKDKK